METHENRVARRSRVLKDGKIVALNYCSVVNCRVRDISATGAKIQISSQTEVPDQFRLMMPGDNSIREAKVMWRRGDYLGAMFTSGARQAPPRKW
ncbi:MAG: PilZ domain-containing protein [Methylocella sp.]